MPAMLTDKTNGLKVPADYEVAQMGQLIRDFTMAAEVKLGITKFGTHPALQQHYGHRYQVIVACINDSLAKIENGISIFDWCIAYLTSLPILLGGSSSASD